MKQFYRIFFLGAGIFFCLIHSSIAHPNIVIELGTPVYDGRPYSPFPIYRGTSGCYRHPYYYSRPYAGRYSYPYEGSRSVYYDDRYNPAASAAGRFYPATGSNIYYGY